MLGPRKPRQAVPVVSGLEGVKAVGIAHPVYEPCAACGEVTTLRVEHVIEGVPMTLCAGYVPCNRRWENAGRAA